MLTQQYIFDYLIVDILGEAVSEIITAGGRVKSNQ